MLRATSSCVTWRAIVACCANSFCPPGAFVRWRIQRLPLNLGQLRLLLREEFLSQSGLHGIELRPQFHGGRQSQFLVVQPDRKLLVVEGVANDVGMSLSP